MKPYFNGDFYDTPPETPRRVLDKLFLNTRFYFASQVIKEISKARKKVSNGLYDDAAWAQSSINVLKHIEGCGGRFHLRGLENLHKAEGPVVFVSNHMSTLETMVFPCIIAPVMKVTFVVKESLVKQSFFGPVMRSRDPIAVGRNNPKEDFQIVMNKGQELLKKGCSIIIFPQTTRTVEFIPEEFNSLGVKLAKKAEVQVIPVAIKTNFWGNGQLVKELGPINRTEPICMSFGAPMKIAGNGKEEHKIVVEYIEQCLKKWQSI
ncbi:MAG: lysophospholipid acyltransferase family protein [Bacillota bacterium]|nr:lysophospholipid acyltransferase family protein [Bacillota bacterium]